MSAKTTNIKEPIGTWSGGRLPTGVSYGKLMMWLFLLSDVFTFSALLVSYGFVRVSSDSWPDPEKVFDAMPFIDVHWPLVFVGIMTFILIASSVTMVLAVEAGHRNARAEVKKYMVLTIIGGAMFLACQAWEWTHMLTAEPPITLFENPYGGPGGAEGEAASGNYMFGQFFFFITGFHGFHVLSGVIINIVMLIMVNKGVFERRGHYEMVEKAGLYWHFVDLVWVFVFTLFYLI